MSPCKGELEELYQVFWWILLKVIYFRHYPFYSPKHTVCIVVVCGYKCIMWGFHSETGSALTKGLVGKENMHDSFFYVSILLFFVCNESSFHPFRREVTRKALFTEKPQHQSLPSLSAPRKKPNFSCCNWLKSCHCHFWLEVNKRLEREYGRTIAKRRYSICSDGNKSSFSVPETIKADGLRTHTYPRLHKHNVSRCTSAIFIYLFHTLGI